MRITIEIDEHGRAATTAQETIQQQPASMETTDGGSAPSEQRQLVAGATAGMGQTAGMASGMNAGPPPEWLVTAISRTPSPSRVATNGNTVDTMLDAGAAPNFE